MQVGIWQLVLILVVVFVLFGAGKLPSVMADIGRGLRMLRREMRDPVLEPPDTPSTTGAPSIPNERTTP